MSNPQALEEQHQKEIDVVREELTLKFKDELSSLKNGVMDVALFLSPDWVSHAIHDYLSNDGVKDTIQDTVVWAAVQTALGEGEKWSELLNDLKEARDWLRDLDSTKSDEDLFPSPGWPEPSHQEIQENPASGLDVQSKQQILFSDVHSSPFERSATSTLCSKTAQKNAKDIFGLTIPSGNAIDAQNIDMTNNTKDGNNNTIPQETKDAYRKALTGSAIFSRSPENATFADVFVQSWSRYGHRCVAFKQFPDKDGKSVWYILDPYKGPNKKSIEPIPLSDYEAKNTIVKVNFYETDKVVVSQTISPEKPV
jgi:hypothetical protein